MKTKTDIQVETMVTGILIASIMVLFVVLLIQIVFKMPLALPLISILVSNTIILLARQKMVTNKRK